MTIGIAADVVVFPTQKVEMKVSGLFIKTFLFSFLRENLNLFANKQIIWEENNFHINFIFIGRFSTALSFELRHSQVLCFYLTI